MRLACLPPQSSRGLSPPAQHPLPSYKHLLCTHTCVFPVTTFLTANVHVLVQQEHQLKGSAHLRDNKESRTLGSSIQSSSSSPYLDALRTEFNANCFTKYGYKRHWPCLTMLSGKGIWRPRRNVASPLPTGGGLLPCFTFPGVSLSAGSYLNLGGP